MSRPKETRVAAVGSSFYKNVSLLMQIVPPSDEFRRHFKKGMFDRPNTAGFLHASHYLSTVCDAKLFERTVRWPILCKGDEATYRAEMRSFLCLLSQSNPDLNFPSILMSHLIQSGGIKFQIIMWKLSQLALRACIKREFQGELLNAPCTSPVQDLTTMHFNNIIAQKCSVVTRTREEARKIMDAANNFLNDEIEILNTYKSEIFDRKENIRSLVLRLPAHPFVQQRLMNVEDSNIMGLWERSIFKKVRHIHKRNKELSELEESLDRSCKLVSRMNSNSRTLDANKFPEIRYDNLLYSQYETQHSIRNLRNGSVVFSALLSLLHLACAQMYRESTDLSDLSQCLPLVQSACKKMRSLRTLLGALNTRIDGACRDKRCAVSRGIKNAHVDLDNASDVSIAHRNVLLQSPRISFNLDQDTNDQLFYEKLCSSSMEGKHKRLFRRYKREYRPSRELPAAPLDFSNSWSNMSGWLSPRAPFAKCEEISFKGKPLSPLYSRLLRRSKLDLKRSREHTSRSPDANYEGLNLTPRKRPSKTGRLTTDNGYSGSMRNLF